MPSDALSLSDLRRRLDPLLIPAPDNAAVPVWLIDSEDEAAFAALSTAQRRWVEAQGWSPSSGAVLLLPGEDGALSDVLLGTGGVGWSKSNPLLPGVLPGALPAGDYRFAGDLPDPELATFAFLAGQYRFGRYKCEKGKKPKRLVLPKAANRGRVLALAEAIYFGRDLINTPPNDLGPAELETAARDLAETHGAKIQVTEGAMLLSQNFPMIHAVGRASDRPPRLIDIHWGKGKGPTITLVGKGICFDTGGLDIKPPSAMALMKKDMGGAAAALAAAHLIMSAKLPVRLRVLVPAADNSIAGNAFRPGDVLPSRSGKTVEIGNTDAEGRLVLADALDLADEDEPDFLVSFATLTGAARSALGPDLPPLYVEDDALAASLAEAGAKIGDPLWRMPFWAPYDDWLKSKIADVNHIAQSPFAGSITAALFLKRFVAKAKHYIHLDIYGWTPRAVPARPVGGEPQAARAVFALLERILAKAEPKA